MAEFITRRDGESLAISCSVPIYFPGVVRDDAAHQLCCPVIVGGRGVGATAGGRLGADAWARTAEDAADNRQRLAGRAAGRHPRADATDPVALRLSTESRELGVSALDGLAARFLPMADYGAQQLAAAGDLVFIVQFLAASMLVSDDRLHRVPRLATAPSRPAESVHPTALISGLEALRPVIETVDAGDAGAAPRHRAPPTPLRDRLTDRDGCDQRQ